MAGIKGCDVGPPPPKEAVPPQVTVVGLDPVKRKGLATVYIPRGYVFSREPHQICIQGDCCLVSFEKTKPSFFVALSAALSSKIKDFRRAAKDSGKHHLSALHIFCRLKSAGLEKDIAQAYASFYERHVFKPVLSPALDWFGGERVKAEKWTPKRLTRSVVPVPVCGCAPLSPR